MTTSLTQAGLLGLLSDGAGEGRAVASQVLVMGVSGRRMNRAALNASALVHVEVNGFIKAVGNQHHCLLHTQLDIDLSL